LILVVFILLSILSITHPHLLPLVILWFLNDVYYYYLIQASILVGTSISVIIEIIPNFPADIPSQENKEFFYFVVIHVIPGFAQLSYLYRRLDILLPHLIIKTIRGSTLKYLYKLGCQWFKGS
jgi:hypothetical protein